MCENTLWFKLTIGPNQHSCSNVLTLPVWPSKCQIHSWLRIASCSHFAFASSGLEVIVFLTQTTKWQECKFVSNHGQKENKPCKKKEVTEIMESIQLDWNILPDTFGPNWIPSLWPLGAKISFFKISMCSRLLNSFMETPSACGLGFLGNLDCGIN